jgi:type II secretory pathway pseudopilin PulG
MYTHKKNCKNPGFTLIELLVVATIIIVLSVMGMVSFSNANRGARDSKRKADVETIRQAIMLSKQQTGSFPANYTGLGGTYLSNPTPTDPQTSAAYSYTQASGCVCADIEGTAGNSSNASCTGWTTGGGFYCAQGL